MEGDDELAGMESSDEMIDDTAFEGEDEEMGDVEGEEMPEEGEDFDFEMFDDEELMGDEESEMEGEEEMSDEEAEEEGEEEAEADMEEGEDDLDALRAEIETLKARIEELEGGNGPESEDEFGEEEFGEEEFDAEDEMGEELPAEEEMPVEDEFPAEEEVEETFDPEVDANYDDEDEMMELPESRKAELEPLVEGLIKSYIKEEKLNDFGKHPGYRKKPMSLPETGSDEGDWNDESVYSEAPFGEKIGDSAPFEKVVAAITEAVFADIKKKI